jgi:site-specific DNA recombinase
MKAILIARVSTEEQKEAGNSLPAQLNRLEKYCRDKGYPILKTCSFDESAYSKNRVEFDRIIDFILSQKEKLVVICDKVDRLSRDIFDQRISLLFDKAINDEIELHFVSECQIINSKLSAAGKFQFSMTLGLARYYSDAVGDSVKRSLEQRFRAGKWSSKAPYGYKNITLLDKTKTIIMDDYEANIMRTAFQLYATGAYSMSILTNKLREDFGVKLQNSFLEKALRKPFYYGEMHANGEIYKHNYPPLISKELFDQVQQVKSRFNKQPIKYAGLPFIFRGLMRCSICGMAITAEKQKGIVYYHCTQSKYKHSAPWIREDAIIERLGEVFKQLIIPKEIVAQIEKTVSESYSSRMAHYRKQYTDLAQEQETITKMMDNLYMDKLKQSITADKYDKFYNQFNDRLLEIGSRISKLEKVDETFEITTKMLMGLLSHAYDVFMSSEIDQKRLIITLVLSNLRIDNESILYEAQRPFDMILKSSDHIRWRP